MNASLAQKGARNYPDLAFLEGIRLKDVEIEARQKVFCFCIAAIIEVPQIMRCLLQLNATIRQPIEIDHFIGLKNILPSSSMLKDSPSSLRYRTVLNPSSP